MDDVIACGMQGYERLMQISRPVGLDGRERILLGLEPVDVAIQIVIVTRSSMYLPVPVVK